MDFGETTLAIVLAFIGGGSVGAFLTYRIGARNLAFERERWEYERDADKRAAREAAWKDALSLSDEMALLANEWRVEGRLPNAMEINDKMASLQTRTAKALRELDFTSEQATEEQLRATFRAFCELILMVQDGRGAYGDVHHDRLVESAHALAKRNKQERDQQGLVSQPRRWLR